MPAISALSLADGQATPVTRTFEVVTTNGRLADFEERSSTTPLGYKPLSIEVRKPASPSAAHRIIVDLKIPTTAVVNGTDVVARFSTAKLELNISQAATVAERKDLAAFVASLLANASFKNLVANVEPYY